MDPAQQSFVIHREHANLSLRARRRTTNLAFENGHLAKELSLALDCQPHMLPIYSE